MLGNNFVRLGALAMALAVLSGCAPTANFLVDKDEGGAPLTVKFTDSSATFIPFLGNANALVPIRSWFWDFGDGVISEQRNPTHTFTAQGTYTVSLTVTTRFGVDTETKANTIKVTGSASGAEPNFTGTPRTGVVPLTVTFTDTTEEGSSVITSRKWDFGDDETSTSSTKTVTHTYEEAGTYSVKLTVTTPTGSPSIIKQDYIVVSDTPRGPQANFSEDKVQGDAPLEVKFTDASDPGDATITRWDWDFGDGETSNQQNPTHTYGEAGTYTVSLTVTTSLGSATRQKTNLIRVLAPAG